MILIEIFHSILVDILFILRIFKIKVLVKNLEEKLGGYSEKTEAKIELAKLLLSVLYIGKFVHIFYIYNNHTLFFIQQLIFVHVFCIGFLIHKIRLNQIGYLI